MVQNSDTVTHSWERHGITEMKHIQIETTY